MCAVLQRSTNRENVLWYPRGNDSQLATRDLLEAGFSTVKDVEGGLDAWRRSVDPTWPQY